MEIFKIDQLNELLNVKGLHHVTIYSPTSRESTANYQADKINFKNQLQKAVGQLSAQYGMTDGEAKIYLKPGYDLLEDMDFWQHGSDGLAFFHSSAGTHIKTLPLEMNEPRTFVGNNFMLRPLIPLLNADGRFYILNLNLNHVQLYEATPSTISEVVLNDGVPTQIEDYTKFLEHQEHTGARSVQGGGGAVHYGQGGGNDSEKEEIQQYFYELSKAVDDIIQCDPLPTVLAGVEYLIPMYRQASDYHKYEEKSIHGSFSEADSMLLHEKALDIMEPKFNADRDQAFEKFAQMRSGDWASTDANKVIKAALTGQVETLFVEEEAAVWGVFNEQMYELEIYPSSTPETKDLLTEAAIKTITQGGTVYQCAAEDMPEGAKNIAAVFRNPVTV
ncbi:baeRF7 domain-containing protein [Salmonirosea aquatica]|uniref:Uncharacterized protein n=1 Tax=Salmonirosea aquatica TaxID=2654236 RepID=A0A7C9FPY2_9BACT|nr:hypothetical protein [Cytophagaceae bacterium SJW1-29]